MGESPEEDVDALDRREPSDAADHEAVWRDAEPGSDHRSRGWVVGPVLHIDAVANGDDALCGNAPASQPGCHIGRHRHRDAAEPLGSQVELTNARTVHRSVLDDAVAERVLGRHDGANTGQSRGRPSVDAGAVEVGVNHVEPAPADQARQAGDGRQVRIAPHRNVVHRHPVGPDALGDRAHVAQGHDLRRRVPVPEQLSQLLLRATHREPGDDVQNLHWTAAGSGRTYRRRLCRSCLASSRSRPSR